MHAILGAILLSHLDLVVESIGVRASSTIERSFTRDCKSRVIGYFPLILDLGSEVAHTRSANS